MGNEKTVIDGPFDTWFRMVDEQVNAICGFGVCVLGTCDTDDLRSLHNEGLDPYDAAHQLVDEAGYPMDQPVSQQPDKL